MRQGAVSGPRSRRPWRPRVARRCVQRTLRGRTSNPRATGSPCNKSVSNVRLGRNNNRLVFWHLFVSSAHAISINSQVSSISCRCGTSAPFWTALGHPHAVRMPVCRHHVSPIYRRFHCHIDYACKGHEIRSHKLWAIWRATKVSVTDAWSKTSDQWKSIFR